LAIPIPNPNYIPNPKANPNPTPNPIPNRNPNVTVSLTLSQPIAKPDARAKNYLAVVYVTTVALKLHTCKPNTNTQRKLTCAFVYKRQITQSFGIT